MSLLALFCRSKETLMETAITDRVVWPEGVVARYLTVAGATVDLTHRRSDTRSKCTGCGTHEDHETENHYIGSTGEPVYFADRDMADGKAHGWAQAHADICRALPRPTAA